MKSIGYSIVYPPGCKELSESLRIIDLRKRLSDLANAFDNLNATDESSVGEEEITFDTDSSQQPSKYDYLKGLLLLLTSPEYTQHQDRDIQLRVGVCVCKLMKLFCPHNPFSGMSDEKALVKHMLHFLLSCIQLMATVRDKGDVIYSKLHTILYVCCQIDLFLWCATVEDEGLLFECIKTTFAIIKNLSVWAWTEPSIIRQMLLDVVVKVIVHAESLLSRDIIVFLLQLLIEPAKSTQPEQHTFARDLILRTSRHLEYNIQMLLQQSLLVGIDKRNGLIVETEQTDSSSSSDSELIGEHAYLIVYALHTIQNSLVAPILPTLELKLKSPSERDRKRSFRLLARLFSEPNSLLHDSNPALWDAFLGRFNDISKEIRKLCVYMVPQLMQQNPDLPHERLLKCIQQRAYDQDEDVRLLVLRTVASMVNETPPETVANDLYQLLVGRCRDKSLSIRKEASTCLANMYKRLVQESEPPKDRLSSAVNSILHMYYHPSLDDKIVVERLFKSSLVPYHFNTNDRVRALFICYGLLDEASMRALQEMFKAQYTVTNLLKEILYLLNMQEGKKISVASGMDLMDRLTTLSNLLPKAEHKTVEQLKRFFNKVHADNSLRAQLVKLTKPTCTCLQATKIMRDLIKHVDSSPPVTGGGTEAHAQYVRCVKILLERSAPVLFDKAFGQELVTQLVIIRETATTSNALGSMNTLEALRLLHSISLYFTKLLPPEEVLDYLVNILSDDSAPSTDVPVPTSAEGDSSTSTTTELDPPTAHELALNILFCLLNGPGKWCDNESGNHHYHPDAYFSDSASSFTDRTRDFLPLLQQFCCTGMTRDFPAIPYPLDSALQPLVPLPNTGRPGKGKGGRGASKRESDPHAVYLAGLAWRRERRRAKLAIQVLLSLLKCAQRFRPDAEPEIRATVDNIVEICMACSPDSPDYIACLTTLGRIALQLPGVYNREFKQLTTKSLVPHVLARDSETVQFGKDDSPNQPKTSKQKRPPISSAQSTPMADWISDGFVPQSTRAKIAATKLMSNWLRGLKNEAKPVAQAVIRLLHRIIIHEGDLTRQGKLLPGEMSRMRLVAAISWLKLAHSQPYVDSIEVEWYQSMTYIVCDPCPQVRSHFLTKLNQGLYKLQLPLEYMAMFAHAADVPDTAFKQRAKQLLVGNIQRRRDFLDRHPSHMNDPKFLYGLLPDFVLPYLIYLLAHDPEWTDPNDAARLNRIKASLWFVMEPIVSKGHNFLFLRKIIERIKHTRDALAPDDAVANTKLYLTCDVALGLLLTRCSDLTIKDYTINVKLPKALFVATPSAFRNPDFAQLLDSVPVDAGSSVSTSTPLIQFTPRKDHRTDKQDFIPAELLKDKRRAPAAPKSAPQVQVETAAISEPSQPHSSASPTATGAVAAGPIEKMKRPVATKQTKLAPHKVSKKRSPAATTELTVSEQQSSSPCADETQQTSSPIDLSSSPSQTTPRKRTRIVLGTPEVESDTTNSPVKNRKRPLASPVSPAKRQRLVDGSETPLNNPATRSSPLPVKTAGSKTPPKKVNIRSVPQKKGSAQTLLTSLNGKPKLQQRTPRSGTTASLSPMTPSSTLTSTSTRSSSVSTNRSQTPARKRGRPPKKLTSNGQLNRRMRLSALEAKRKLSQSPATSVQIGNSTRRRRN